MVFKYVLLTTVLVVNCFSFPTDLNIRRILDQLYSYSDAPQILSEDRHWPDHQINIGQVGGLAVAPNNDVVVFHRANRRWSSDTFNFDNTYALDRTKPIETDTILHFDPKTGRQTHSHGANKFFMPHGLTIDAKGNHWLTDVALHQVFRFPAGQSTPDITLGTPFTPGNTDTTFCKPTDVAVASNGDFFVADGYCNSRVLKFSENRTLLKQWGKGAVQGDALKNDMFKIPHSLSLVEDLDLICVADREDKRIICYNAGLKDANKTGQFDRYLVEPSNQIGRIYAIEYSPVDKVMYAVVTPNENQMEARGYTIQMDGNIIDSWGEVNMFSHSQPHDVTVSPSGNDVYVGDVGDVTNTVTRFRNNRQTFVG